MSARALSIGLGRNAAQHIAEHGWQGKDVSLLLGASGGPKWLILGQLDRLLFGDFLLKERDAPLKAVGSSVGSWRHACLSQDDPISAIDRFEDIYVNWAYSAKPDADEVSAASAGMLAHIFGAAGSSRIIRHATLHSYIVTARGKGLSASKADLRLALGMGGAALANAVHRRLLQGSFQRVVFASESAPPLSLPGFATQQVPLGPETVTTALHASGSIPFVLKGERDIPNAPRGHYWDGGIIDYHFDLSAFADDRLILYPHFRGDLTAGWFDKLLPWRRNQPPVADNLILLHPSPAFIASLPGGKIPDRSDFTRMNPAQRVDYWRLCIARSQELAADFQAQIEHPDPLSNTTLISDC